MAEFLNDEELAARGISQHWFPAGTIEPDEIGRGTLQLEHWEICLAKGLLRHGLMNQQQVIALLSSPGRTVHHNLISEIARRIRFASNADYPPASRAMCVAFLQAWPWGIVPNIRSILLSGSGSHEFGYHYHPVGQGMFCSGMFTRRHRPPFRWVYDCGTDCGRSDPKRGDHVRREIAALAAEQPQTSGGRPHLDLVALSHFDEDHLSGILDLIATFTIGTLLLPYLTPWDRLIVALDEGAAVGSDLLDFLLEPVAFLLERADGRIARILLVPASGDGPALPPLLPPDGIGPDDESEPRFPELEPEGKKPEVEEDDAAGADGGLTNPVVRVLPPGAPITVDRAWEFLPYNDARLAGFADEVFKDVARPLAQKLTRSSAAEERKVALDALIKHYDSQFKTPRSKRISGERRNLISLFLYSGPIGNVILTEIDESIPRHRLSPTPAPLPLHWLGGDRFGQMFTGDGYLHTKQQWTDFERFFAPHGRLHRGGMFQVMHHGAKGNWQTGLAARIDPLASIFCSDPAGRHRHPKPEVLSDFASWNPKQVDAFHGWAIRGRYLFA